jgi:hypothetical protein
MAKTRISRVLQVRQAVISRFLFAGLGERVGSPLSG